MRKILYVLAFVLVAVSPVLAQNKDEQAILEVIRQEEEFWNKGDIEGYVSLYAPDDSTRMILGKGAAYGRDSILAFYKKYWPKEKMGRLELDGEGMERLSDNFYYVTGYFHVTQADGRVINGRYSSLMKKVKGKWYLYTDHSG
ncbi:MAG: nuclear transport factor 2 family protein [Gemmatimonadaceae bacterium]|nr:nuclear transport factor 2 family protein [Chitinophagaceae bacterium]